MVGRYGKVESCGCGVLRQNFNFHCFIVVIMEKYVRQSSSSTLISWFNLEAWTQAKLAETWRLIASKGRKSITPLLRLYLRSM
jgi:hypothetical protein